MHKVLNCTNDCSTRSGARPETQRLNGSESTSQGLTPFHCVINSQHTHCDKHIQSVFALLPLPAKTTHVTSTSKILLSGSLREQ